MINLQKKFSKPCIHFQSTFHNISSSDIKSNSNYNNNIKSDVYNKNKSYTNNSKIKRTKTSQVESKYSINQSHIRIK